MFNNFLKSCAIIYFLLKKCIFWFFLAAFPACLMPANAAEFKLKKITVSNPHLVVFGKNAKSGAGYLVISNKNSDPVILKKVTADFGKAMLHKTDVDKKGVAKMKHLESMAVPGNGLLKLEPGGTHIMFMNISIEFDEISKYRVTLFFEEQGSLDVDLKLKSANKSQKAHKHKHGHGHSNKHDH
ncbi:copper chaperone PCu(A)C [Paracoccaceae bacterium]|nr:copper chaperone PCu(A)C [Paracoccaceae bacterium]